MTDIGNIKGSAVAAAFVDSLVGRHPDTNALAIEYASWSDGLRGTALDGFNEYVRRAAPWAAQELGLLQPPPPPPIVGDADKLVKMKAHVVGVIDRRLASRNVRLTTTGRDQILGAIARRAHSVDAWAHQCYLSELTHIDIEGYLRGLGFRGLRDVVTEPFPAVDQLCQGIQENARISAGVSLDEPALEQIRAAFALLDPGQREDLVSVVRFGSCQEALTTLGLELAKLNPRPLSLRERVEEILSQPRDGAWQANINADQIMAAVDALGVTPYSRLTAALQTAGRVSMIQLPEAITPFLEQRSSGDAPVYVPTGTSRIPHMALHFDFDTAELAKVAGYAGDPEDPVDLYFADAQGRGFRLSTHTFDPLWFDYQTPEGYHPVYVEYGARSHELNRVHGHAEWSSDATGYLLELPELYKIQALTARFAEDAKPGTKVGDAVLRAIRQIAKCIEAQEKLESGGYAGL